MRKALLTLLLLASVGAGAQVLNQMGGYGSYDEFGNYNEYGGYNEEYGQIDAGNNHLTWGRDTTRYKGKKVVPIGVRQWTVEERLGTIVEAENTDTAVHAFQFWNNTEGLNGEYTILGNLGSPRLSRIFFHRGDAPQLLFTEPYSFFIGGLRDFRFSNTLSPLTNLAYHKAGSSQNGQERVRAYFASNINKLSGIGFKLDYLYGRGQYNAQSNSQFGGTVFGYYLADRYNLHAWIDANHSKTSENGGIEDDKYITDKQSFQQSYGSKDIPTTLTDTWNRNDNQTYYLTHRVNLGSYHEVILPDSLKPKPPEDDELLSQLGDSLRQVLAADTVRQALVADSLREAWVEAQVKPREFIAVGAIMHTMQIDNLHHTYYSYNTPESYYTNHYYGNLSQVHDQTNAFQVRNTLGIGVLEGFNKWAAMGVTLFATHTYRSFLLPELIGDSLTTHTYKEQDISVGGELSRQQGTLIHYDATGEVVLVGKDAGQFTVDGTINLSFPLGRRDTVDMEVHGFVKNLKPGFYFRHYHSQFEWWDNTGLSNEFKTRIEGSLEIKRTRTRLTVGVENVKNYTYFGMTNTLLEEADPASVLAADYSHSVSVRQKAGSVQVFMAMLEQKVKLGPLHFDMEATYQASSDEDALPLPKFNGYANLYLAFTMAKVLNVELGGDLRYFTSYYAPDYAVSLGQYAVQDASNPRVKIGNYPICNVYVNVHLKRCRLYAAVQHVNAGSGNMFWGPHYPMDPLSIHFGLSWNFFN